MPSTIVHVGFALVLAAALLGTTYDRRALVVVAGAVAFLDLDAFVALVIENTHRAAFHTLLLPLGVGAYLYADTRLAERSTVRERWGDRGVRVAWTALVAVVVSGTGLDLFTASGVNPFYPLFDQFYAFTGSVEWSSTGGLVQTFVEVRPAEPGSTGGAGEGGTVDVGQRGSTEEYRVATGVDPTEGPESAGVERTFPVVYAGWQTILVVAGVAVTALKLRWADSPLAVASEPKDPRMTAADPRTEDDD
ncbi:MAG: metal-dependent hydrolase [Haloarculaceae archaeon]